MPGTKEASALEQVLGEQGKEDAISYPDGFDVVAAALDDPQPGEAEQEERRRQEEDESWLLELARAGSASLRVDEAREFLEVPQGDSDVSSCWSSDQSYSDEPSPNEADLFDPTTQVSDGKQLPLEHMGRWHAYKEMKTVLQLLIELSAKGPRAASPETARAHEPEAEPLSPRVINRLNRKETRKGILYPRPTESWGGCGRVWRPDKHWERNTRQLADSLVPSRDVAELGNRLVSAAQDWADIQRRERRGRGQLSAVTDMLSSVRTCLESIHGGSLDTSELKTCFERMLRHVQHLYVASIPPTDRMHGGEIPRHLPYRDVADRKYHSKPPVPSRFVDASWAKRAPACKPAPKRQTKAQRNRAARQAKKAAEEVDAFGQSELQVMLDDAQKQKVRGCVEGVGYSKRAVTKVLGKPPGLWTWEDDHPDPLALARHAAISKTAAASAPRGVNKKPPSKVKVRAQLQEELTAAKQGVAALEEKATQLRAQLDSVRLTEQAEAAERDTVTLAATLAGVMDSTEVLLKVAKEKQLRPPQSPPLMSQPASEMEGLSPQQMDASAARRAKRQALKFAKGGYSYEQVVLLGGSTNLWNWELEPESEDKQQADTWHYQGADARISKERQAAMAEADPTRPVEPPSGTAVSTSAQTHRPGGRHKQPGFRVQDKHLPTAGKFLFDGPGHAPRTIKYKQRIVRNVQAAQEEKRAAMRAHGIGR